MSEIAPPANPALLETRIEPERDIRWIFLGPNGLRAGWGVLLFALIFVATYYLLSWALGPLFLSLTHGQRHMQSMPIGLGFLMEGFQVACMVVATVSMALIERRPILSYGYQGQSRALRFFSGLGWGFVAISVFFFVLWKAHLLSFDGQVLHGSGIWKYGMGWGVLFLMVAVFEESTMRGYLQYTLSRGVGFWWSALVLSFLFGFAHGHNPGESYVGLVAVGTVGLVWCLSLWYTGSLWFAVGFHAAWDWGESYFYGTSDSGLIAQGHLFAEHPIGKALWSGGATGPEGSALTLPMLAIFALCMWLWWRRKGRSPFADAAWKPAPVPQQR
jgi:hypothetical protein